MPGGIAEGARGMVATSHPAATLTGWSVLSDGGNAIDAAIAANAYLGLAEPAMCGVGGDLMAFVWEAKTQTLHAYNGSGRSPHALTLEKVRDAGLQQMPERHPFTWTVPGCVEGWARLLERFGTRSLGDILDEIADNAETGCRVACVVAQDWDASVLRLYPSSAKTFLIKDHAPGEGYLFRNPDLAKTYRRIARDVRDFYAGALASEIATFCQANGGLLSAEDLAAHEGEWVQPLSTDYRGHTVWAMPPNTQGLCVLQMLNMLEALDLAAMGWGSDAALHAMIEAKKLSYEDRARFIADPAHAQLPTERLISKEHAHRRWKQFSSDRALSSIAPDLPETPSTTYLCAADEHGNAVSLIQSIYYKWGSGAVPDGLGFCLQNRGLGFSLDPNHPCCVAPRKRPLHTIIPGFVTRGGKPWLCFGVMGGPMQPQAQVQVITNLIDFGMNVQTAGEAPRWRHDGSSDLTGHTMQDGGRVFLESGLSDKSVEGLTRRGHVIDSTPVFFGGYQGILFDHTTGLLQGGSDPRKDGCALGL